MVGWVGVGWDKEWGTHAMRRASRFGAAHTELEREGNDKNGNIKGLATDKVGNKQNKNNK